MPNLELLREAYAIIDGIPDERINLNTITDDPSGISSPHKCGTVGCAIGWLGMHPKFQALGLKSLPTGGLRFKGEVVCYEQAGAHIFGISINAAHNLFAPRNSSALDDPNRDLSDKAMFKRRVRIFLKRQEKLMRTYPISA